MLDWLSTTNEASIAPCYHLYLNGKWLPSTNDAHFEDLDPATGMQIARVADASQADVDAAILAAHDAQPGWEALVAAERAAYFYRAAELFAERQEAFARVLIAETGSSFGKAMYECSLIPVALRQAASLTTAEIGEVMPSNIPGKINRTIRRARGVIGVISPWNFPLYLSVRGFAYALALGNTIVLKPSEDSPLTGGLMLAELFADAGFPAGTLNVVTTSRDGAAMVGKSFVEDRRVAGLSFTGSTNVGRTLSIACAGAFKPIMLELGGKNPILVLEDADINRAVDICFFGAFLHQGQICMSADRIIVAEAIYDEFLARLVEKAKVFAPTAPAEPTCVIGPIINTRQVERIKKIVDEARQDGATVHCGGNANGNFYEATVLSGINPDMRIWNEEIFGPVTCVMPATSVEEAIRLANDTEYGLSAAIVTSDPFLGEQLAERINAGMVHVNDSTVHDEPHCPFSGLGASGGGGKWGPKGAIEAFTTQRWITTQRQQNPFPF
ncbi:aldehyde dehydrogenase family protein [Donghicola sp. B5-SW-15]|uniref:Salicylaldehyde dehydrogenase n=2 Tax=Donghicola mangrovi TaxID=2729614 RepID=A0A850QIP4_9RHOB|nr:aldehyde dehydrogenase family protein [Donghicola mangrovi]NVO25671.1 aldehyde dehydrogenase family protein [Donghicola mangrovi]